MNPHLQHDIDMLAKMVKHLEKFQIMVSDEATPFHIRQIMGAAVVELKRHIKNKTNDIRRMLGEKWDY